MSRLKTFLEFCYQPTSKNGYGLTELMAATALTTVVIGAAGFGIQAMLQSGQTSNSGSETAARVNQTAEFISDEIRAAMGVETDAAKTIADGVEVPSLTLPEGATPVLALQVPDVAERVVYYIAAPNDDRMGKKVLYRWGPLYDGNGSYKTAEINAPDSWQHTALVDLIDTKAAEPDCDTDWKANPPTSVEGFYSCVKKDNNRLVELHIKAAIEQPNGKYVAHEVTTMVFARSIEGDDWKKDLFQVVNKKLTLNKPANVRYEVLGGAITCGPGGANIPVATNLYFDDSTTPETWDTTQPLIKSSLPKGTTVDVESIAISPSCGNHYKKANTKDVDSQQVIALKNGDSIPAITPFDNQTSIDQFLHKYIEDGKVKLADNQVIYLFEVGVDYNPLLPMNQQVPAFDLQDNVVLATIDPPS